MTTKKIFWDVDTQNDFMNRDGALYVPGAEEIKPNLRKLTEYALAKKIPLFGSVDKHFGTDEYKEREGELQRWSGPFPDHCMNNTSGELKIHGTLIEDPEDGWKGQEGYLEVRHPHHLDNGVDENLLESFVEKYRKSALIFEKQSYDVFTNPAATFLLQQLSKDNYVGAVVYGVATDYCVKAAVLGMRGLGIQTYVVLDAIKGVFADKSESALEEMAKAGAKFTKTEEMLRGGK